MAEDKFLQRREFKHLRSARNQKAEAVSSNILEAIAQPPTRMKITVRKEDLKQVLEAISSRDGRGSASIEQRLNLLRRRQTLRGASQAKNRSRLGVWRPVLHTIPEEL